MALYAGLHPAQLKDSVTSEFTHRSSAKSKDRRRALKLTCPAPGGCTIAGLLTLEDGRVRSTMARAIQVATNQCVCAMLHPCWGVSANARSASGLGQEKK